MLTRISVLLAAAWTMAYAGSQCGVARADSFVQEIKNGTAQQTAFDLKLMFTKAVAEGSTVVLEDSQGRRTTTVVQNSTTTVIFPNGQLPGGRVLPKELLTVRWQGQSGSALIKSGATQSRFTDQNSAEIVDSVASLGQPPAWHFQGATALVELTNPDAVNIAYSNIQVFDGNALSRLNVDQFFTPSGTLVPGLPTTVTLLPGESRTLSVGAFDPGTYQLALADVAAIAAPEDRFRVGAAAAIPEPSALLLVGSGLGFFALARTRRTRIAAIVSVSLLAGALSVAISFAQSTTLGDLTDGHTMLVDDKLFFNWEIVENHSRAAADVLSTIVLPLVVSDTVKGVRFDGLTNDSLIVSGNELIDVTVRYAVRALDDTRPIVDAEMALVRGDINDIFEVSENVFEFGGSPFFDDLAFLDIDGGNRTDRAVFGPHEFIEVQKRIVLGGGFAFDQEGNPIVDEDGNPEEIASFISRLDQTVSQVPEPSAVLLFGTGALGILRFGRHRRKGFRS